jgi:hypothetical protein
MAPTLLGILPYAGVDIAAFEVAKEGLVDFYGGVPPGTALLGAGLVSSTIAQIIAYPLGFIRTRMQVYCPAVHFPYFLWPRPWWPWQPAVESLLSTACGLAGT